MNIMIPIANAIFKTDFAFYFSAHTKFEEKNISFNFLTDF